MKEAVVVGLGQWTAGDDVVGLLVARSAGALGVASLEAADATVLISLLADGHRVILVDAVVCRGLAGQVIRLRPDELGHAVAPVSSHGIGVVEVLSLVTTLHGVDVLRDLEIVGVSVSATPRVGSSLSPRVSAAVGPAAVLAARLARGSS